MNRFFLVSMIFLVSLFVGGCGLQFVPVDSESPSRSSETSGLMSYRSLHFDVYGYDLDANMKVAGKAEEIYRKVMFDTNLMSFKPRQNYRITIYATADEYRTRTGYPSWSAGGAQTTPLGQILPSERELRSRTSIVTYEKVLSPSLLAHEVTHLIFNEFMEFETSEEMAKALWLNEGLATFEEMEFYEESLQKDFVQLTRTLVKKEIMPIREVVEFRPMRALPRPMGRVYISDQPRDFTNIDLWYWHVRFLTEFLIQSEGHYNFYILLNSIKNKKEFSDALREAYPGKWRSLGELEAEWRQWL